MWGPEVTQGRVRILFDIRRGVLLIVLFVHILFFNIHHLSLSLFSQCVDSPSHCWASVE